MRIYDFDKTIYINDSSIDFFKFCVKRNKKTLLIIPKFMIMLLFYYLKIIEKEKLKSTFFSFVKYFNDIEGEVEKFWKSRNYELKDFYMKQKSKKDIIVSASPEFLLSPVAQKYGFKLIATKVDTKTGKLLSKNCHDIEKVNRLNEQNIKKCDEFYSDSLSDEPVSKIAKKSFIVKDNKLIDWKKYKPSRISKIKSTFINRDFFTFVAIGVINAFNGVWIAYVYSLFIKNAVVAYIMGFFTSLCIAYVLNSVLNFKVKLGLKKFIGFTISNIPNFIIQVLSVILFIDLLRVPKIFSYAISAVIAVPITFILIKMNVFKNK